MRKYIQTFHFSFVVGILVLSNTIIAEEKRPSIYDKDAVAIKRDPPVIPEGAETSGYCCVVFDINATGRPINITPKYCTSDFFASASVETVSKWEYKSAKIDNKNVIRTGVQSYISFYLTDMWGIYIPSKTGFLEFRDIDNFSPPPTTDKYSKEYRDWTEQQFVTEKICGLEIS